MSFVAPKVEGHPRFQGIEISPTKSLGLASTATTGSSDGKLLENKDKTHHKTSYERSTDVFFLGGGAYDLGFFVSDSCER
jgi:hypothetical protein